MAQLTDYVGTLGPAKLAALRAALRVALDVERSAPRPRAVGRWIARINDHLGVIKPAKIISM